MKIFDFIKKAGERLIDNSLIGKAFADEPEKAAQEVKNRVQKYNLDINGLDAKIEGEKVILSGTAKSAEQAEKAILAAGNIEGVSQVESRFEIEQNEQQSEFYTVEFGDNLSKISKQFYGDPNQYMKIFEANKPMLSDPDKIYPGQKLRIPSENKASAAA